MVSLDKNCTGQAGWAQVNGRNAISWEDKFKLDVWYVDNWSVWLDVKIIVMTVVKVLRRDGISQTGHATAQEFLGSHAKAPQYDLPDLPQYHLPELRGRRGKQRR